MLWLALVEVTPGGRKVDSVTMEDPELWMRDFARRAAEMAERAQRSQQQLANLEGVANNDYVSISLSQGGALEDIRFTSQIRSISPEELANQVKNAYAVAYTDLNKRATQLVADIGPEASELASFMGSQVTDDMRERAEQAEEERRR